MSLRRAGAYVLVVWLSVSCVALLSAALIPTWPASWELPWSGFTDFALTQQGELLVYVRDFDRILRYSPNGSYLGSVPASGYRAGRGRIACTQDGRTIIEHGGRVVEYSRDWTRLEIRESEDEQSSWIMSELGSLERGGFSSQESKSLAGPGDLLFGTSEAKPRTDFHIDGLSARRRGHRVELVRHEGTHTTVVVGTPWYLVPVRAHWPLALPFYLAMAWVLAARCSRSKGEINPPI